MRRLVDDVAMATEDVVSLAVSLLADRNAARDGLRSPRLTRDLARRPKAPTMTPEVITSGRWAADLTEYAGAVAPRWPTCWAARWAGERQAARPAVGVRTVVTALRASTGGTGAVPADSRNATYEAAERRRDERQAERERAEAAAQREALEVLRWPGDRRPAAYGARDPRSGSRRRGYGVRP